jgi:hypothetical protein
VSSALHQMSSADLIGGETRTPSILIIVYCCMHHRGQIDHYTLDDLELSQLAYAIDQVPGTRSYLAENIRISERGCVSMHARGSFIQKLRSQ